MFFLIGAQKSGTTSLFDYLAQHPEVTGSKFKETRFYTTDELFSRGRKFFEQEYFGGEQTAVRLEGTAVGFAMADTVAPRIQSHYGESPGYIVILRDPVQRAWSGYLHARRNLKEPLSFREAFMEDMAGRRDDQPPMRRYYFGGQYATHLKSWLRYVNKDQIKVVWYEDLRNSETLFRDLFTFMSIDPEFKVSTARIKNKASTYRWKWLSKLKANPPALVSSTFKAIVPRHLQHDVRMQVSKLMVKQTAVKERMKTEDDAMVRQAFADEISELESILEVNLDHWRINESVGINGK